VTRPISISYLVVAPDKGATIPRRHLKPETKPPAIRETSPGWKGQ
jgi:hypothetical protein